MAQSTCIENYREHLAPLLASFQSQRRFSTVAPDPSRTFTDQFGNSIEFNHTEVLCFAPPLLKLLKDPSMGRSVVEDVDKGHLSYSLYKHADTYYILYESRVDLYGLCGNFASYVVLPTLEPVIEFVEAMIMKKTQRR